MELSDKVLAVAKMQAYITNHMEEKINLAALYKASGYSKYHALKMFKSLTGTTPLEAIRAIRLTQAAKNLRDIQTKVVDIALSHGFETHDGFTKAFTRQFSVTPKQYSNASLPIAYFIQYPIEHYFFLKDGSKTMKSEKISKLVTVTAIEKPARKLVLLRARETEDGDYLAFCQEMGCEWDGILNSISEKTDIAALLTFPKNQVPKGFSNTAAGVEVPLNYNKQLPENFEMIELPPCTMLYFQGAPFEDDNDFCLAIEIVYEAISSYAPSHYGWQYAPELAPTFNFGASSSLGAKIALSVKK